MVSKLLHQTFVRAVVVSCAALLPALAQVSVLSDLESGTNQNAYGAYWYVYDDNKDLGNSTFTNMGPKNADGTYNFAPTANEGNTATGGTPGYGAKGAFKLGDVKPHSATATWGNMIGMGTMLAPEGSFLDLTGAQKIDFYAKVTGPATTVSLRVEVCTPELDGTYGGDYGYYHIIIPITSSWAKYTIPLDTVDKGFGKLVQWDWSAENKVVPFNIKKIEKIQWCISVDGNTAWKQAEGALYLDDISISPFKPHFPDQIEDAAITAPGAVGLDAKNLLADFESAKNKAKYYSYCYTDVDANPGAGKSSVITAGAEIDSTTNKYKLTLSDSGATGKCASLQFELGTLFTSGSNSVMPFVGIGTNLCNDPLNTVMTDLSSATAVYFDYKLGGAVQYMSFEFKTNQLFGNKDAVYYIKLPTTNGAWKGARVDLKPTNKMVLPTWKEVTPLPIDLTQTLKFQWKVQDAPKASGVMAIDNVYVIGKDFSPVRMGKTMQGIVPAFSVKQAATTAIITFAAPQHFNTAALELITVQGRCVASQSIRNTGMKKYQVSVPISSLGSGTYLMVLRTDNADVKRELISISR